MDYAEPPLSAVVRKRLALDEEQQPLAAVVPSPPPQLPPSSSPTLRTPSPKPVVYVPSPLGSPGHRPSLGSYGSEGGSLLPAKAHARVAPTTDECEGLFRLVDTDVDGVINHADLIAALRDGAITPNRRKSLGVVLLAAEANAEPIADMGLDEFRRMLRLDEKSYLAERLHGKDPGQGRWVERSRLVTYLERQRDSGENCRALPLTVFYFVVFLMITTMHMQVDTAHELAGVVSTAMALPDVADLSGGFPTPFWTWLTGTVDHLPNSEAVGGIRVSLVASGNERPREALCSYSKFDFIGNLVAGKLTNDCRPTRCRDADASSRHWLHPNNSAVITELGAVQAAWEPGAAASGRTAPGYAVQMVVHNTRAAFYSFFEVRTHVDASGLLLVDAETSAFDARPVWMNADEDLHSGGSRIFLMVCDTFFFLLCFPIFELHKLARRCRRYGSREGAKRYADIWSATTWLSMIMGWWIIVVYAYCAYLTRGLNQLISALPAADEAIAAGGSNRTAYEDGLDEVLDQSARVAAGWRELRWYTTVTIACICLRFVFALRANPRLQVVTHTLWRALQDLSHLLLVFFALLAVFVIVAYLLWGSSIDAFSTIGGSCATSLLMIGGARKDPIVGEMEEESGALGILWMWLLNIVMAIIVLNISVAVVFDVYCEVRSERGKAPTLWQQAFDMATDSARTMEYLLSLADLPPVQGKKRQVWPRASPPAKYLREFAIRDAVRAFSEDRLLTRLVTDGVHEAELISAASLSSELGAAGWAEQVWLDEVIKRAAEMRFGDEEEEESLSFVDSMRLCGRVDANVRELSVAVHELHALFGQNGQFGDDTVEGMLEVEASDGVDEADILQLSPKRVPQPDQEPAEAEGVAALLKQAAMHHQDPTKDPHLRALSGGEALEEVDPVAAAKVDERLAELEQADLSRCKELEQHIESLMQAVQHLESKCVQDIDAKRTQLEGVEGMVERLGARIQPLFESSAAETSHAL